MLLALRVKDGGKSEGRSVMERIGFEQTCNINPRESGLTSTWSLITRTWVELLKAGIANDHQ